MSALAGFDFALEISNPALTRLVKRQVEFRGVPLNPPFELQLPFPSGALHLIVNDLKLELEPDNWVTISFVFSQSSLLQTAPSSRVFCPLSGSLDVSAQVGFISPSDTVKQLVLSLREARVAVSFTPAAEQTIAAALANSGITLSDFMTGLRLEANAFAHGIPDIPLPMGFEVTSVFDMEAGLTKGLRFTRIEVRCIGHSDRNRQALCLLGNLLPETRSNGQPDEKTSTAIAPGQEVATSMSPRAFQALVFCPAVRDGLRRLSGNQTLRVIDLPTVCGISPSLDVMDVSLTRIVSAFGTEGIQVLGGVKKSGTCYEAEGFFSASVKLVVENSALVPKVQMDEPHIGVTLDWYCVFGASVVLTGVTGFALGMTLEIVNGLVSEIKNVLSQGLGNQILPSGATAALGSNFSSAQISPEGLTLQGLLPIYATPSDFFPSLSLESQTQDKVQTLEKKKAGEGFWTTRIFCQQEEKDYSYTEYAQRQIAIYKPVAILLTIPFRAQFAVRGQSGPAIPLLDVAPLGSNTVEIQNVECTYPMPLGTGGSKVTQTVHIDYLVKDNEVRLRNRPNEGNYGFTLEVSVLDCAGMPAPGITTVEKWIIFKGSVVEMGAEYLHDFQQCMHLLEGFNKRYLRAQSVPIWKKVTNPRPWQVFAQAQHLGELQQEQVIGVREAAQILLQTQLAQGENFIDAYHSPTDVQLGEELKETPEALALDAVRSELTAQINNLTDLAREIDRPAVLIDPTKLPSRRR